MKTKLLSLFMLLASFISFSQWNQVGSTQFTNFATDASLTFDNSGVPYLAYINPAASNKVYVKLFNGSTWVDVSSPEVSTVSAANVVIKINPVTNEPTVAYRRISDDKFDVYKFDGTSWSAVVSAEGAGDLLDYKLQMQFSSTGNLRVAGQFGIKSVHFYTQGSGSWSVNDYSVVTSGSTQMTFDFTEYENFFYQFDGFSASYYAKRSATANGAAPDIFNKGFNSSNFREVSGIAGENIVIANNLSSSSGIIKFGNGTSNLTSPQNSAGSKIGFLKLRESITDTNYYLMFSDSNDDLVFQKYKRSVSQWFTLPSIGISTNTSNFFADMKMNPVTGNMFVYYLDSGRVSVQEYTVPVEVPKPIIYVDENATGNNDGTSFANAYTSLQTAISNIEPVTTQIWIAAGRYTPAVSGRGVSFVFDKEDLEVYGGFNGTETLISDRNINANPTILSGDLDNDGNTGSNIFDNSYHVVQINANGILLDGLTIQDGACTEPSGTNARGGGILKSDTVTSLHLKNTTIFDNYGSLAAGIYASFANGGSMTIENCNFNDNDSRYGSGMYVLTGNNQTLQANISNSIFFNNRSRDFSSSGYAGSAFWFRANGTNSNLDAKIINCTFAENIDIGTNATVAERSTVGLGKSSSGTLNADVSNCIFYGNTTTGGATAISVGRVHTNAANFLEVNNSIGEDAFSNLVFLTNTTNVDPLFTDVVNNDFTLQSTSTAIDTGDNNRIISSNPTDILGNPRVGNQTVDMGAYEQNCSSACYTLTLNIIGNGYVENSSTRVHTFSSFPANTVLNLLPINVSGNQFDFWSGDFSGSSVPLTVTMDSDKTINAHFKRIPIFVDVDATGTNDGSSWANAFTDLNSALAVANSNTLAIWIAEGTYSPGTSRTNTFNIDTDDLEIYGGFNGTESLLSERNYFVHQTVLSGDVNGDDTGVDFSGQNRTDNNYHVVSLNGNNILLDGLEIRDGHANGTSTNAYGGGIVVSETISGFIFKNLTIKNNVGFTGGAVRTYFDVNASAEIENTIFDNNVSQYGSGLYFLVDSNRTVSLSILNSLFSNNTSKDQSTSARGYTGSAAWIRANATGSNLTTTITNCIFANNTDIGTQSGSSRGALALSDRTDNGSTHSASINNTILYGNTGSGGSSTLEVNSGHTSLPNTIMINHSIGENSFSNISSGSLTNTSNADPLFTDPAAGDFSLQAGSPAIDFGDNSYVPAGVTLDLNGNDRIINGIVDLGSFEFDATLSIPTISINEIVLSPNPAQDAIAIFGLKNTVSLQIIDILGNSILKKSAYQSGDIDVSGLKSGIYIVVVRNDDGAVTKRFIKK